MKRWAAFALAGLAVAACRDASGPSGGFEALGIRSQNATVIPGDYIVTFSGDEKEVEKLARSLAKAHKGSLKHIYKSALKGMAISGLSDAEVLALASDPRVDRIEADQVVTASFTQSPVTWGIDRVDQRALPLDNSYTYASDGTGVTVYIIDTGINFGHQEFAGRAVAGIDKITLDGTAADCNGHGTHVAGTVGGATFGIAKNVGLVAVRVLDCSGSGSTSGVIAGIDWVTANRVLPAAANMSLGGGFSATLNQAVAQSIASGVTYAVAAGNSTANACNSSPSSEPAAITVGATSNSDAFASFSNYGSCVDISAPGVSITSAWLNSSYYTISGTSMASPHVAGAVALYLAANPAATPAEVTSAIKTNATPGAILGLPSGTPNSLLYIGDEILPPPPPPPPASSVASFTYACSGLQCSFNASGSTNATSYNWNFGDNSTGNGVTVTHSFALPGSSRKVFTVTLTTVPSGGQSSTSKLVDCNKNRCQ